MKRWLRDSLLVIGIIVGILVGFIIFIIILFTIGFHNGGHFLPNGSGKSTAVTYMYDQLMHTNRGLNEIYEDALRLG